MSASIVLANCKSFPVRSILTLKVMAQKVAFAQVPASNEDYCSRVPMVKDQLGTEFLGGSVKESTNLRLHHCKENNILVSSYIIIYTAHAVVLTKY